MGGTFISNILTGCAFNLLIFLVINLLEVAIENKFPSVVKVLYFPFYTIKKEGNCHCISRNTRFGMIKCNWIFACHVMSLSKLWWLSLVNRLYLWLDITFRGDMQLRCSNYVYPNDAIKMRLRVLSIKKERWTIYLYTLCMCV